MPNEELVAILMQGVEKWNEWRDKNQEAVVDLTRADLNGANLREADLSGTDLSYADLGEAVSGDEHCHACSHHLSTAVWRCASSGGLRMYHPQRRGWIRGQDG
jgi:hypothetical protein